MYPVTRNVTQPCTHHPAAHRSLGGTLGGLLASVPSIVVVASIGVALEVKDADEVRLAMMASPSSGLAITLYVLSALIFGSLSPTILGATSPQTL